MGHNLNLNEPVVQQSDKMGFKDETILSIGMMSLTIGLLVGRFTHFGYLGFSLSDFGEGILTGVSLIMNLFFLAKKPQKQSPLFCHNPLPKYPGLLHVSLNSFAARTATVSSIIISGVEARDVEVQTHCLKG